MRRCQIWCPNYTACGAGRYALEPVGKNGLRQQTERPVVDGAAMPCRCLADFVAPQFAIESGASRANSTVAAALNCLNGMQLATSRAMASAASICGFHLAHTQQQLTQCGQDRDFALCVTANSARMGSCGQQSQPSTPPIQHRIDPQVDCVFKALLGREDNRALLINFLNAFLASDLEQPITQVEILNPYMENEFIGDKLSIVDVMASGATGRLFQIEIQITVKPWLRERILYNWTSLFSAQMLEGDDYKKLRPAYSIWLIAAALLPDAQVLHRYKLRDEGGQSLNQHGGIWLLELSKFDASAPIRADDQRWLKFFSEGSEIDDDNLPEWMNSGDETGHEHLADVFSKRA